MLRRWRAKRAFRQEAKRLAVQAEPAVRDASEAIYEAFRGTVADYESRGIPLRSDRDYLKHWVVKKRRRFSRG